MCVYCTDTEIDRVQPLLTHLVDCIIAEVLAIISIVHIENICGLLRFV
jgi:hypothetical protein